MTRASAVAAVITLLGAAGLAALAPRPVLDNQATVWFPAGDPRLAGWARFTAAFGGDDTIVALVEGGDALGALRLSAALSDDLAAAPGVRGVTSARTAFATETEVLLDPDMGGLDNLRFVGRAFDGPLNRALRLWERDPARAVVVAALVPGGPARSAADLRAEREGLLLRLEPFHARARAEGRALLVAGQPFVNVELDRAARDVDARAMPLLVLVCVVVLLAATRSPRLSLALLAPVGLGVLAGDGALGLAGVPSNLVVAIVKPLVFVLLLASGFQVAVAFADHRRLGLGAAEAAAAAARDKARPTLLCLLTAAIGFGSLSQSSVAPIRTFGWLTAASMVLGAPLTLLGLPLLLRLFGPAAAAQGPSALGAACAALVAHGRRRAGPWLTLCAALCVGGTVVAVRLRPQPYAIEYFPRTNPMRVDHDALAARGASLATLEALVALPAPIGSDTHTYERLDDLARRGAEVAGVRGCVGLPLLLREAVHRTARTDALPPPYLADEIVQRQGEVSAAFLAEGGRLARLSFLIDELDPDGYTRAEDGVRVAFEAAFPPEAGARLELTGSYGLLLGTQRSLLGTLRRSLLTSAVLKLLVLSIALGSLRLGLAAIPSNAFPIAAIFASMALFGIPLDVGTSMTAAIALGIAVDGTLRVLDSWREGDLEASARATGRAMVLTSFVVGLGFLSLAVSDFGPTRNFGVLCAIAMLTALVGNLVVLPATLRVIFGAAPGEHPRP